MVLSGKWIVRHATLDVAGAVVLNIYAGITPELRGVHGSHWASWTGPAAEFGSTLHLVDPGVDTGTVRNHARPVPGPQACFVTYPLPQLTAALPALSEVLEGLCPGRSSPDPMSVTDSERKWYHQKLGQYLTGLRWVVW